MRLRSCNPCTTGATRQSSLHPRRTKLVGLEDAGEMGPGAAEGKRSWLRSLPPWDQEPGLARGAPESGQELAEAQVRHGEVVPDERMTGSRPKGSLCLADRPERETEHFP